MISQLKFEELMHEMKLIRFPVVRSETPQCLYNVRLSVIFDVVMEIGI